MIQFRTKDTSFTYPCEGIPARKDIIKYGDKFFEVDWVMWKPDYEGSPSKLTLHPICYIYELIGFESKMKANEYGS